MGTSFNVNAVFQANVRCQQHLFAAVDGISNVVQPSLYARLIARVGEVVALVRTRHPDGGFRAIVHDDLLGQTKAQVLFEELAVGFDIDRKSIPVIQPPHVDTTCGKFLCLVLEGGPLSRRRLIPLCFIVKLDPVSVRVLAKKRRAMRQIAFRPAYVEARSLEGVHPPFESLRTSRTISYMSQAWKFGCREF